MIMPIGSMHIKPQKMAELFARLWYTICNILGKYYKEKRKSYDLLI